MRQRCAATPPSPNACACSGPHDFFRGARAPIHRQAHRLEIEACGADHVHLGFLRDLRHHRGVAAELDRAGVDEGADAVLLAQLAQALHRLGDEARAIERRGGIELGAGEGDEQMLVHQGAPELVQSHRAENRLYLHAVAPSHRCRECGPASA
jgi:hypothetical protein